jgi:hypothetical protein
VAERRKKEKGKRKTEGLSWRSFFFEDIDQRAIADGGRV